MALFPEDRPVEISDEHVVKVRLKDVELSVWGQACVGRGSGLQFRNLKRAKRSLKIRGDILYCSCQEGKLKKFVLCKNSQLQNHPGF